jgi:hypothetical protein
MALPTSVSADQVNAALGALGIETDVVTKVILEPHQVIVETRIVGMHERHLLLVTSGEIEE